MQVINVCNDTVALVDLSETNGHLELVFTCDDRYLTWYEATGLAKRYLEVTQKITGSRVAMFVYFSRSGIRDAEPIATTKGRSLVLRGEPIEV